jgi:hypothetical protein
MFKFFNKNFFKFSLGFLAIIFVSLLFMVAVSAYAATVSKISFTSEERSVPVNQISEGLTIQSQDSSSTSIPTPETLDLEFFSTSQTGEFLSSTGNPATKTMNKNTSNRTFYYRDSSSGVFTITVKAIGRDTGEAFEASQKISVGTTAGNTGEILGANTEVSNLSATSGASTPAYSALETKLEVSAGQDRLTSPGSPLNFQAQIKKNTSSNSSIKFSWSFGDGSVGDGPLVTHTYKYPGEYALVLNASSGNVFASSRLKVLVVDPEISISDKGDYVEILNNSKYELNLFNWKMVSDNRGFVFQPDTIVFPKSKIKLDKIIFTMKGEQETGVVLKNSIGGIVAKSSSLKEVEKMNNELEGAKKEVLKIIDLAIATGAVKEIQPQIPIKQSLVKKAEDVNVDMDSGKTEIVGQDSSASNTEILYQAEQTGVVYRLTNFIKRLFYQ